MVVPSRQVGAPSPPSMVTAMVADVAVTDVAVMVTPPAGSVKVRPTVNAASVNVFVAGFMSSSQVCKPLCALGR